MAPAVKVVGVVSVTGSRATWTIPNFFNILSDYLHSNEFRFAGETFTLVAIPTGIGCGDEEWFEMFFLANSSNFNNFYGTRLGITGESGEEIVFSDATLMSADVYYGMRIVRRSTLNHDRDRMAPGGTLRLFCDMNCPLLNPEVAACTEAVREMNILEDENAAGNVTEEENTAGSSSELSPDTVEQLFGAVGAEMNALSLKVQGIMKLLMDLKDLLHSGKNSDVLLRAGGKGFKAHSAILAARSPVFSNKLESGQRTFDLDLGDADPDAIEDFLYYFYTGTVLNLNWKNAVELYRMAELYAVDDLKTACAKHLKDNITTENICDLLDFTIHHKEQESELLDSATQFFLRNSAEILHTEKWSAFLGKNIKEGNILICKALQAGRR